MSRPAVLVTGGAKRIGVAISRRFAAADWHVVIHCGRSWGAAQALAAELPSAEVVRCDLADSDAAVAMVTDLAKRLPDWRALVNSASVFRPDSVVALDIGINWEAMQVNAATPAEMAQAYLLQARSQAGRRVIQVTVANGRFYGGGMTAEQDAQIDDGQLDVVMVLPGEWWRHIKSAIGLKRGVYPDAVPVVAERRAEFELTTLRPEWVATDGERSTQTPATFGVLPGALEVYVP